jgi:two-component system OmpR family response regulator
VCNCAIARTGIFVSRAALRVTRSFKDGTVVALSGGEFRLLSVFVEHPNRVLDRNQLMDLALGRESTPFDRAIDVQVSRLRNRLRDIGREPAIIKTVRNEGYVLAAAVERIEA